MTSSTLTDGLFIKFPHPLFSRQLSLEKAPRNRQSGLNLSGKRTEKIS